jgi:hypothetical protein
MRRLGADVVRPVHVPVHPRAAARARRGGLDVPTVTTGSRRVRFIDPLHHHPQPRHCNACGLLSPRSCIRPPEVPDAGRVLNRDGSSALWRVSRRQRFVWVVGKVSPQSMTCMVRKEACPTSLFPCDKVERRMPTVASWLHERILRDFTDHTHRMSVLSCTEGKATLSRSGTTATRSGTTYDLTAARSIRIASPASWYALHGAGH